MKFTAALAVAALAAAAGAAPAPEKSSWHAKLWDRQEGFWRQPFGGPLAVWRPQPGVALPPKGAMFVGTMNMPVIGRQTFALRVLGKNSAQIILIGRLALDEPATFSAETDAETGRTRMDIDFNPRTLELLSNWRTRITRVEYDAAEDVATITISPPLIPSIRVKLRRTSTDPRS